MRKITALAVVAVLSLTVALAAIGCGQKEEPAPPPPAEETTPPPVDATMDTSATMDTTSQMEQH
jgi:hypothetical protein